MPVWVVVAYLSFTGALPILGPPYAYASIDGCLRKVAELKKDKKPETARIECLQLTVVK